MNNITPFFFLVIAIMFVSSCRDSSPITNSLDYDKYLRGDAIDQQKSQAGTELSFWQHRLSKDTGNYVDMVALAKVHLELFGITGRLEHLKLGDSLLFRSSSKLNHTDPEMLFAIAQQAITNHKFQDAQSFNEKAVIANGDRFIANLLAFDAGMELGNYKMAGSKLESLKDKNSFDYLIRKAKFEDHKGDLNAAIYYMEKAFNKVETKQSELYCWTLSNLGDMYGHASRVKDAYQAYLRVLRKNPNYHYALKGIAWIAYANDHNEEEAKRILHYILSQKAMPEIWLTLSEIASWQNNQEESKRYLQNFKRDMQSTFIGDMYNKYRIQVYAEDQELLQESIVLGSREVESRPTPETYDWLAWSHFKNGNLDEAFRISNNYVHKRSHEPEVLYHTALIFAGAGKKSEAKMLLEACLESEFELGPVLMRNVRENLESLAINGF